MSYIVRVVSAGLSGNLRRIRSSSTSKDLLNVKDLFKLLWDESGKPFHTGSFIIEDPEHKLFEELRDLSGEM